MVGVRDHDGGREPAWTGVRVMQLYVDLDGVLADFDSGYALLTGSRPDKAADDVDWKLIRQTPNFYANLPPMGDMAVLWARISRYQPIILTGVPANVPEAAANKRAWVERWLPGTFVIPTKSSEKATYARPGDVLIDDWEKYRPLWEKAGGRWITHVSAIDTSDALDKMGLVGGPS